MMSDNLTHVPRFLAIWSPGWQLEQAQSFSPHVMEWSEGVWLIDMRLVMSYWQKQLMAKGIALVDWLRSCFIREEASDVHFICVGSQHPWRAMLSLLFMQERSMDGVVMEQDPFAQRLYRQVSWSVWWHALHSLGEHFACLKVRGFHLDKYLMQCRRLQEILPRLGKQPLAQFFHIEASAIRKRFGSYLEAVWQWTFHGEDHSEISFPWLRKDVEVKPCIRRHLDHPLREWEGLESYLVEDFDKLCFQGLGVRNCFVLGLEWRLCLSDSSVLTLGISFRHPHLLSKEMRQHRTALLQAKYAFAQMEKQRSRSDYPDGIPAIVGWELVLAEQIFPSLTDTSLFRDEHADHVRLDDLENKLPVPLSAYLLHRDWMPEDAYMEADKGMEMLKEQLDPWLASAFLRPLFIYENPLPYHRHSSPKARSETWQFLEKSIGKWWQQRHGIDRHYYQVSHRDHQRLWVYRCDDGNFYVQGIYA